MSAGQTHLHPFPKDDRGEQARARVLRHAPVDASRVVPRGFGICVEEVWQGDVAEEEPGHDGEQEPSEETMEGGAEHALGGCCA